MNETKNSNDGTVFGIVPKYHCISVSRFDIWEWVIAVGLNIFGIFGIVMSLSMQKESDVPAYSFRGIYKLFFLGLIAGGYKLFKCIQNYNRERIINQRGTWTRGIVLGRGTDKVIPSNYRESVTQPKSAMRLKGVLVQVDLPKGKRIIDFQTGTTSKKFYNDEEVDVWFYEHLFIVEKRRKQSDVEYDDY